MYKLTKLCALALPVMLLSSCIYDDFQLPACDSEIRVVYDWLDTEPRDDAEQVDLAITPENMGQESRRFFRTNIEGTRIGVDPGTYEFSAWEEARNITVEGQVVTLVLNEDGTATEPQTFSGGAIMSEVHGVYPGDTERVQVIHVPMHQQTRELDIRVFFITDGPQVISGIEGNVTGIATSRLITRGFPPMDGISHPQAITNGRINYVFGREDISQLAHVPQIVIPAALPAGVTESFFGSRMVLGVDGAAEQLLSLRIYDEAGSYSDVDLDITGGLVDFHVSRIHEPLLLELIVNLDLDLNVSIVDWHWGTDSWLIAE